MRLTVLDKPWALRQKDDFLVSPARKESIIASLD